MNPQVRFTSIATLKVHRLIATDIMHAYLGLAALATLSEKELPAFDPMFCISWKARQNLKRMS